MTLGVLAALLAVGLLVGFVSGLIGIGGGVLIVPFLYFFYGHSSWSGWAIDPDMEATIAHATSLAVILPFGAMYFGLTAALGMPQALAVFRRLRKLARR